KGLGGGTSINGMVWARGHQHDFDRWAAAVGDDAWGYAHVLDIYKRIEDWHGVPDPQRRGKGGNVFVQPAPDPSPLAPAFLDALESVGVPMFADQNGVLREAGEGGALTEVGVRGDRGLTIVADYLDPVMERPTIAGLPAACVHKLVFDDTTVAGDELVWRDERHVIGAEWEVILPAGAIQ